MHAYIHWFCNWYFFFILKIEIKDYYRVQTEDKSRDLSVRLVNIRLVRNCVNTRNTKRALERKLFDRAMYVLIIYELYISLTDS